MGLHSTTGDLFDWATSDSDPSDVPIPDRSSPQALGAICEVLRTPLPIDQVERIEALAKYLWRDVLAPGSVPAIADALECESFFNRIGFLFKYKPYGVKIASPFGYSLFDLKDGEGFSFQIHLEPKLEAFHILGIKSESLVYISSVQEWEEAGCHWASPAMSGVPGLPDPPFVHRPLPGDVVEIRQTQVVHTVLGCILEEYASCSVDAVERLLDQNARSSVDLPPRHPDISLILSRCRPGLPIRRVKRVAEGWQEIRFGNAEPIINVAQGTKGTRLLLKRGEPLAIDTSDEYVTLVVAVDSPAELMVEGRAYGIDHGGLACILPGREATVAARKKGTSVAVHQVTRELVAGDWTR